MRRTNSGANFKLFKPTFYVLKWSGFFPFSIDFVEKTVSIKVLDILQFIVNVMIWFSIANYRLIKSVIFVGNSSRFGKVGESTGGFMGFTILTGTIIENLINRRTFLEIIKSFDKFDEKVCLHASILFLKLTQFHFRSNN